MAEKDWLIVRIKRKTAERIEKCRKSLLFAYELRLRELRFDDKGHVAFDQVVNLLLDMRDAHAARRAKAAAKKKGSQKKTSSEVTGIEDSDNDGSIEAFRLN